LGAPIVSSRRRDAAQGPQAASQSHEHPQDDGDRRRIEATPTEAGYAKASYAWFALAVLLGAYTCSFIDRQLLAVLVQPVKADLKLSDTQISLLQGVSFSLFYCGMGLPLGYAADRWHRRNLIILGMAIWTVATVLCGFASSFWELFGARMLVGFGEAALAPAAYSLIVDYFSPRVRGRALTIYTSGTYAGAGLGYVAGGQVASWADGFTGKFAAVGLPSSQWQASFIAVGVLGLLLPPLLLMIREPARHGRASRQGEPVASNGLAFMASRWRFYLPFISSLSLISMLNYSFFSWIPAHLQRKHHFTITESALTFGLTLLILGPIGMACAGYVVDRFRRSSPLITALRIPIMANLATIPFALMLTFASSSTIAVLGVVGIVFFPALTVTLGPFAAQLTTPNEYRGISISAYLLILNIVGLGLGPTVPALIADNFHMGVGAALAVVAMIALPLSALLNVVAIRQSRRIQTYI
jgi:MFS family permease